MNEFPITSIVASCAALMALPLTMLVSMRRADLGRQMGDLAGVAFGDADDLALKRRIRAFGNFVEYAPICLLLLWMSEASGASTAWMWTIGGAFLLGRTIHALGMLFSGSPLPRAIGMMLTYVAIGGPAYLLLRSTIA